MLGYSDHAFVIFHHMIIFNIHFEFHFGLMYVQMQSLLVQLELQLVEGLI